MPSLKKIERLLIKQVNRSRARQKLPKLSLNRSIRAVARKHSARMAKKRRIWHGNGVSAVSRRLRYDYVGENCAMVPARKRSRDVAADLHRALMTSPGHKANILNPKYGQVGIGVKKGKAKGYTYYFATQLFCEGKGKNNPVKLLLGIIVFALVWLLIYKACGVISI
jgi:uncharacterized protein YkwD